jgi:GTPase
VDHVEAGTRAEVKVREGLASELEPFVVNE